MSQALTTTAPLLLDPDCTLPDLPGRIPVVASARILKRAWQIYVAHIFLFTIYLAEISYVATRFQNPLYAEEYARMVAERGSERCGTPM